MIDDPLSEWLGFLALPASPRTAMSPLELDGYLTGIIVTPDIVRPSQWLAGLWGQDEPMFQDVDQARNAMGLVMDHYYAISARIDEALKKLEAKQPSDYRPLYLACGHKPEHDQVRAWIGGFWKAMALEPQAWSSLVEDERTRPLVAPFVGFIQFRDEAPFEPAENIDELLDAAAAAIPRAIVVLRKLTQIRLAPTDLSTTRSGKIGRNDPCPCGSGNKYKRCCGAN